MSKKIIISFIIANFIAFNAISQDRNVDSTLEQTGTTTSDNTDENLTTTPSEYKDKDFTDMVVLQGINKITARVSTLTIKKNETKNFGNIEIEMLKCWSAPPEEEPENKALLRVWEQIPGEEKKRIFFGWMFSSSPALSALEHPVYDIVVTECKNIDEAVEQPSDNQPNTPSQDNDTPTETND